MSSMFGIEFLPVVALSVFGILVTVKSKSKLWKLLAFGSALTVFCLGVFSEYRCDRSITNVLVRFSKGIEACPASIASDQGYGSFPNPDATHIEVLDFEIFDQDWKVAGPSAAFQGGRFLINKTEVGDYSFCRMNVDYNRNDDALANPLYLFDTIGGQSEYEFTPNDENEFGAIRVFREQDFKTYFFTDPVFDVGKAGTYWRKVAFVWERGDQEICFEVRCAGSSAPRRCFDLFQ